MTAIVWKKESSSVDSCTINGYTLKRKAVLGKYVYDILKDGEMHYHALSHADFTRFAQQIIEKGVL